MSVNSGQQHFITGITMKAITQKLKLAACAALGTLSVVAPLMVTGVPEAQARNGRAWTDAVCRNMSDGRVVGVLRTPVGAATLEYRPGDPDFVESFVQESNSGIVNVEANIYQGDVHNIVTTNWWGSVDDYRRSMRPKILRVARDIKTECGR